MEDARIAVSLPNHPKTKKLIRNLGAGAAWYLVRLFLWAAENRSDGDLSGLSDEDIELAIDWPEGEKSIVAELARVRFLEGDEGHRSIHDWVDHNPWAAGQAQRSEKSRFGALCKQHGRQEAARLMPEYASRIAMAPKSQAKEVPDSATGTKQPLPKSASGTPEIETGSAPSPSPSPLPLPLPFPETNTPLPPKGGGRDAYTPEFEAAWKAYPDRPNASKADAFKAWNARIRAGVLAEVMAAGVERYAAFCRASRTEPRFVKQPATFFGPGGHFLAEWSAPEAEPDAALTPGTDEYRSINRHAPWVLNAGFRNIWEAENEGCYERNAHLFRDGKKIQAVSA